MAKVGTLLIPEQAKSVLLAYLASDSADSYLKMTFIHDDDGYIEVKESNSYDAVITRVAYGVGEVETFEDIEDFAKAYNLEPQLNKYRQFIQTS